LRYEETCFSIPLII